MPRAIGCGTRATHPVLMESPNRFDDAFGPRPSDAPEPDHPVSTPADLAAETKTPCSIPPPFPSSTQTPAPRPDRSSPHRRSHVRTEHARPARSARSGRTRRPRRSCCTRATRSRTAAGSLYIVLLGALTALGPFTIDLYLPAFPVLEEDFQTTAAAIQLTLTGTMIGFALGQLIVGPLSDKVGRRIPLLSVTALHVVASVGGRARADARAAVGWPACCRARAPRPAAWSPPRSCATCSAGGASSSCCRASRSCRASRPCSRRSSARRCCSSCPGAASSSCWRSTAPSCSSAAIVFLPETLPPARRQRAGRTTVWQRYRSVLQRPGLHRRAHHRRHDVQRAVLVPLSLVVPVPADLRVRRPAVRAALRGQLARRRAGRAGGLAARGPLRPAVGDGVVDRRARGRGIRHHRHRPAGLGLWGTIVPAVLLHDRRAASRSRACRCWRSTATARRRARPQSIVGATNFGVAGLISPIVGWIAHDAGITPTTMAAVMVGVRGDRRARAVVDRASAHGRAARP